MREAPTKHSVGSAAITSKRRKPIKDSVEPRNPIALTEEPAFTPGRATDQARRVLVAANLLGPSGMVSRVVSWPSEHRGHISSVALLRVGADPAVVAEVLGSLGEVATGEAFVVVYQKGGA